MSLRSKFFAATYDRQMRKYREGRSRPRCGGDWWPRPPARSSRSAAAPEPTWPTTGLPSPR